MTEIDEREASRQGNHEGQVKETPVPAAYADTLNRASVILLSQNEEKFEDAMAAGVSLIVDAADVDRLVICRSRSTLDGLHLSQIYRWNRDGGGSTEIIDSYTETPYAQVLLRWETHLADGNSINGPARLLPGVQASVLHSLGIVSLAVIPVFISKVFWGFALFGDTRNERSFDDETVSMMRSAAFLFANAFIRIEMESEISGTNELTRVMFDTAPIGLTTFDENLHFVDCNNFILNLFGVTKQHYLDHFLEFSPEYQSDGRKTMDKLPDVMWRALSGEKMTLEWMHQTPSGEPVPCELILTRANYNGKYLGLGYIHDLRSINKMQQAVAEAEKNIQLLETEVEKIYYDALTGIYNRRYFDENLKRVIKTLTLPGDNLSLLMIDIDFFKNYNDTYGHNEGDKCLKTIAETLKKTVTRTDDFVARFGGEEFVAVLPNTNEKGARMVAARLLAKVRKCNMPHEKSEAADCVTISIGVTTGKVEHTQTEEDYIKRADKALYRSKQDGRDRYTFESL